MILGRNWSLPHYEKNAPFRNVLGMACFASMSTPGKALQTVVCIYNSYFDAVSNFILIQFVQDFSPAPDALFKSLEVEIRSGEPAVLLSYTWFTTYAAKQLGIMIGHWYNFLQISGWDYYYNQNSFAFQVGLHQSHAMID